MNNKSTIAKILLLFLAMIIAGIIGTLLAKKGIKPTLVIPNEPTPTPSTKKSQSLPSPSIVLTPTLPPTPISKTLSGGTHIFQTFNNCGPASLSMTLSYYGQTVSQLTLGSQLRPYQRPNGDNDDKSVTLSELSLKATEYGYTTYHRPAGDIEILKQFIVNDIPVITRTWLKTNEDIGHYRVIKGYDDSKKVLIQDDSLQGKNLEYTYKDFSDLWQAFNYEFLVLIPENKQDLAIQILGDLVDEDSAWKLAYELSKSQQTEDNNNKYALFNQAVSAYYLGEYQTTIDLYEQVQASLPKRMLWYQIEPILAYYQTGNFDRVLEISDGIFKSQNRAFSELHWLRGKIFEQRNQVELTQEEFNLAKRYNTSQYWLKNIE